MSRSFRELSLASGSEPTTSTITIATLVALAVIVGLFILQPILQPLLGDLPIGTLLVIVGLGGVSAFLITFDERLWFYSAFLSTLGFIFAGDDAEGLAPTEILFHFYGTLGLLLWYVKELVVNRRSIINSSFDFLIAIAFGVCLATALIASVLYNAHPGYFVKELLGFTAFFFYFPIRKMMRDDRHVIVILGLFLFITFINGAVNLVNYQERVVRSALAFGEVNARATSNESYSALMTCLGAAIILYGKARLLRWFGLGIFTLGAGLLIISLSRGPVVAAGAGIVVSLLFASTTRAVRLLLYVIVGFIINISLVYLIFPGFADSIFTNIGSRFETLERVSSDKSLGARFDEYESLTDTYIPASPWIGYGFGVFYSFYNKPFATTYRATYTHSGYLHALYKYGIPAGLFLLFVLIVPLLRAPYMSHAWMSSTRRLFFGFAVSGVISLLIINITSNSLYSSTTLILWGIVLALFDYLYGNDERKHQYRIVTSERAVHLIQSDGTG